MTRSGSVLMHQGFTPNRFVYAAVVLLASIANFARAADDDKPVDAEVILAGATLYDGTGADGVVGDVALRGSSIVAVGKFVRGNVDLVIDCHGLIVAPGFIDLHTHSDNEIVAPTTRANVNYLTQGCTSVVTGNCGSGPVDTKAYLAKVDAAGAGTNVLHLLPQGALRSAVMNSERRKPSDAELEKMKELAERAMLDGCWGMSTGLIYVPSVYASTDELIEIATVVGRHGGIYASHIRGEGSELMDAVAEAIEIGKQARLPVHISHFKASGSKYWGTLRVAADLVEKARSAGQRVTADQYPYIASSTSLEATVIPPPAREGGRTAMIRRLDEAGPGSKLYQSILNDLQNSDTRIRIAYYKPRHDWFGKTLAEIASAEGKSTIDLVYEIERNGGARIVNFGMNEDDVRMAMRLPWVATASDGFAMTPNLSRQHPRSFGTFSRKIGRYAIADQVISLPHAIRSASGLPADILGLQDRGYLKSGYAADVVVLDPATFRDQATFDEPYKYSTGARYVFVNGTPAIYDGTPTGALAGRALRMPKRSTSN